MTSFAYNLKLMDLLSEQIISENISYLVGIPLLWSIFSLVLIEMMFFSTHNWQWEKYSYFKSNPTYLNIFIYYKGVPGILYWRVVFIELLPRLSQPLKQILTFCMWRQDQQMSVEKFSSIDSEFWIVGVKSKLFGVRLPWAELIRFSGLCSGVRSFRVYWKLVTLMVEIEI